MLAHYQLVCDLLGKSQILVVLVLCVSLPRSGLEQAVCTYVGHVVLITVYSGTRLWAPTAAPHCIVWVECMLVSIQNFIAIF